ncbi:MAG: molecular chaperone HtpG [Candidatus Riflebacteria bacterium HGW-Riflebacteria-1]|jgi:molecular chaperone HtpG|nr:MAG: molecular chaperone HtpG [Candidatus Riflebacteria bacterium HGW-Riflebacteria-1]
MATTYEFKTEARQLLDLMIHSVYSHKEIFLRELISNASDALDKLRFNSLTSENLRGLAEDLHIRLGTDSSNRTLTISDNGIGMTHDEIIDYIGTIAKSGTGEFAELLKKANEKKEGVPELIGQFGVGFYSSFMVADKVELISRKAGEEKAWKWTSSGEGSYTIEEATRETQGTSVTLHLKPEDKEDEDFQDFVQEWVLRQVVKKYSDFVGYPIKMSVERTNIERDENGKPKEGAKEETVVEDEVLNSMKAIWLRPEKEVSDEEYREFYKHISHDWNSPLKWVNFKAEGTSNEFSSLLFLPEKPGFDLFMPNSKRGINLYVKRVFIMNDCEELIPDYLRFVKGVVDSESLSLNISREILQHDRLIQTIRKSLTRKVLDTLKKMLSEDRQKYVEFWKHFGSVIKEGLFKEPGNSEKLFECCLFQSTSSPSDWFTMAEYVERIKPDQDKIYYLTGESREVIENSPHLEAFRDKGYEVLLMTDPVDEVWVQYTSEFKQKKIKSAARGSLELGSEEERKKTDETLKQKEQEWKTLLELIQNKLDKHIKAVRLSGRMSSSAACLVSEEGEMTPHLEALLRASGKDVPQVKRTLELNPGHPLLGKMHEIFIKDKQNPKISEYAELLYGQALLAEGGQLPDPSGFNRKVAELMVNSL